jgi:hypothetical protein
MTQRNVLIPASIVCAILWTIAFGWSVQTHGVASWIILGVMGALFGVSWYFGMRWFFRWWFGREVV